MTGDGRLAAKRLGHDAQPPVRCAARLPAGMPRVGCALVRQLERDRREPREALPDLLFDSHCLPPPSSMWRASNRACMRTNSSMSPVPPNSLKLTQRSVEKLNAT